MSATDVLDRFGTWSLVRFTGALLVFVLLHLVRLPVLLVAVVLEGAMSRVDAAVTAAVSRDPQPQDPGKGSADGSGRDAKVVVGEGVQ